MSVTTKNRKQVRNARYYDIPDCGTLPSVTTILSCIAKPALVNWAAKVEREMILKVSADLYEDVSKTPKMSRAGWLLTMSNRLGTEKAHDKERTKAGDIGSQVHALIEWTLKGELCYEAGPSPRITDKAQWAFMAWEDWRKSVSLRPLAVEQVVWSRTFGYAGTLDLLAEVEGVLTVIDWKTGKAVYGEAHLQNAAYRKAVREMGHGDPKQGLILRLPKVESDPNFEPVVAKSEDAMFPRFMDAFRLWKWCQEVEAEYLASKEKPATGTPEDKLEETLRASLGERNDAEGIQTR